MLEKTHKQIDLKRAPRLGALRRLFQSGRSGWLDVAEGLSNWRLWHLMGTAELRQRYSRSRLGQFWLTLSTGILIASLGVVWSVLWGQPMSEMMPYFAVSIVLWSFFSGIIGDAASALPKNKHYFINQRMSFATAIFALLYQHLIVLAHNAVIIVLVFLIFQIPLRPYAVLAIPGLCLAAITGFWLCYVVAILCTRYRDLGQVVVSLLQVAFLVTPVLWKPDFVPDAYRETLLWNPFAVYLSIIRDPILGEPWTPEPWIIATIVTGFGFVLTLPLIGRYKSRIIYWL